MRAALAAYANQDLPFERLVEVLNPPRSPARHPLFQVSLALQNSNVSPRFDLPGLAISYELIGTGTAKFDLWVALIEQRAADGAPAGLVGLIEYASDLFDRSTVEILGPVWFACLRRWPIRRGRSVRSIFWPAERQQLLHEWNDTSHPVPEATLPELFEQQVAKHPDATAVVFEDASLTYAELNERANRLAHLLIAQGCGPECIVALALPRSLEMVVALLGILKSGAAYLAARSGLPHRATDLHARGCPAATVDQHLRGVVAPTRQYALAAAGCPRLRAALPHNRLRTLPIVSALIRSCRRTPPTSSTPRDLQENQKG